MPQKSVLALSFVFLLASLTSVSTSSGRPRGVAKSSSLPSHQLTNRTEAHLYVPSSDGTWQCLDGSKIISFEQVNDVQFVPFGADSRITVIVQTVPTNQVLSSN